MKKTALGLILSTIVIVQGCSGGAKTPQLGKPTLQKQKTSVETTIVDREPISKQIHAFGTVESQGVVKVTPQVSNRITDIYVELGDTVTQGEPLAKIYDATFEQQVAQARAQIAQNRATFAQDSAAYFRKKELYDRQLISASTLDQAKAAYLGSKSQLQSAVANLKQSQENLNNTVIRSPIHGVVLSRNISVGDLASTGQTAFKLGNLTGYRMHVYLPREEWQNVRLGQKVHFQIADGIKSEAVGRVSHISPRLDPTTGLGEVIISFTEKTDNIATGMLVQAVINVKTKPDAIVVPRAALVENVKTVIEPESNIIQTRRTYSAFVVRGDSMAFKHKLTLGIEQGNQVEVKQGLQAGDEIVTTGQNNLTDSSKVRVVNGKSLQQESVPLGREDVAASDSSDTQPISPANQSANK